MTRNEIEEAEWSNDENWGGPRWGSVYFSKKDPRIVVPKRIRWMGWTANLAHASGVFMFVGVLLGIPLAVILILVLTGTQ